MSEQGNPIEESAFLAGAVPELQFWEEQVIRPSFQHPVVVDFWAPWCQPCRILGPILEKLAQEAGTRWSLVKINVDEFPTLAQQFQIRSVPTVVAVRNGQIVDSFVGVLPEPQIRAWLNRIAPDPFQQHLTQLFQKAEEGDRSETLRLQLEELHQQDPNHKDVRYLLARLVLPHYPERARQLLEPLDEAYSHFLQVRALRRLAEFLQEEGEASRMDDLPTETLATVRQHLRHEEFEPAIQTLLELLPQYRDAHNHLIRDLLLAIFALLGKNHPLTRQYRRRFEMLLF